MINAFAHITFVEAPAGVLLFFAGCAVGAVLTTLIRRFRAS